MTIQTTIEKKSKKGKHIKKRFKKCPMAKIEEKQFRKNYKKNMKNSLNN